MRGVLGDEPGPGGDGRDPGLGRDVPRRPASRRRCRIPWADEAAPAPRQEFRHPGPGPRPAHQRARGLRRGVACGRAQLLGAARVVRAAVPAVPPEQAAARRRGGRRARRSSARWSRRRRPPASARCSRSAAPSSTRSGRFLADQLHELTVACDGDYFIRSPQADEARGEAATAASRSRWLCRPRATAVGVSTTLGRGRGGAGPDGLAVIAASCMLADAAAAGVQAVLGKPDGFGLALRYLQQVPGRPRRRSWSWARRSAWPAAWRSRREPEGRPGRALRRTRARRGEAPRRGAPGRDRAPPLPVPRARRPRGRRRRVRRPDARAPRRSRIASPSCRRPTRRPRPWAARRRRCSRP